MALTHITPIVLDVPAASVALIADTSLNGIRAYIDAKVNSVPTAAPGDNSTQIANTAFVAAALSATAGLNNTALTGTPTAPTANPGANTTQIATTAFVTTGLNLKANINSPTLTGIPTAPTAGAGTNNTQIANTAFVQTAVASVTNTIPVFSGGVGGSEGGEIHLAKPQNTSLGGDVVIDVIGNSLRIFEAVPPWRGAYIDLTQAAAGVGTNINSGFPAGTRLVFPQAAAPTGWTQDWSDAANNRMLRTVGSGGGGVGGAHDPTFMNVVPPHTHGFTTGGHSADHAHGYTAAVWSGGTYAGGIYQAISGGTWSTSAGTSNNHSHSGGTDNGSSQTNWSPRYINMIIASKN